MKCFGILDQGRQAGAGVLAGWVAIAVYGSRGLLAISLDRRVHGSPRGLLVGRDGVRDDGYGLRFDASYVVRRLDCRIAAERLPRVDPVRLPTDHRRLQVRDADLAETELDGPLQEVSVGVDANGRAGIARAVEDQLGDLRLIRGSGPDRHLAVHVDRGGVVQLLVTGETIDGLLQEAGVLVIQLQPGHHGIRTRNRFLDSWKADVFLDLVPDRPRTDPEHHVRVRLADLDRLITGERLAREDRRTLDQQVTVPGEAETGPDKQLMSVGRDDLAQSATELHAVQGVPRRLVGANLRCLG